MALNQALASGVALLTLAALALGEVPGLKLNRSTIALVGAGVLLALGVISLKDAERTIDLSTLMLLLSMMVINAVLELSGFFTWVGEQIIERVSRPLPLLILVVLTAGVLSMLFLNDPVCVMLTPLVTGVVLRLGRNPMPYLIALACAANVGSVATITGNPQNILIGASSGIGYLYWLARLGPIAALGLVIVVGVVVLVYRHEFFGTRSTPATVHGRLPVSAGRALTLAEAEQLIYVPTLRKSLIVIAAMLVAFVAGVNVTLAAFIAACVILVSRRVESSRILALVDWPLLLMFGGLFIVMGSLEVTGASEQLFALFRPIALGGTAALTLVTTVLSNLVSNVPAVLLFRPLVDQFPDPTQTWLTLAAASTLAGNLTLVGSVANLIVAEQARKFEVNLTFAEYLKAGPLITALTLLVAVVLLG
ncbi:MAG: SLC13 family permease [Anaerolineae bacterium]|nr:SLC13 family permease [Thermoflexales bacterium]MDW8394995.1 SLC13 family permease [Anaerolineae bacterium]